MGLTCSKIYSIGLILSSAGPNQPRQPEIFGKTPPSSAYCRSNSLHRSPSPVVLPSSPTKPYRPPRPPPPPASAVAMYADRSSGRKRSVRDRLGSGGGSRSRSDDAKRCGPRARPVQIVACSAIPVLVGATCLRLLVGSVAGQRWLRKCCLGSRNQVVSWCWRW